MDKTEIKISGVGASALSEALKTNATLTEFDLFCAPLQQGNRAKKRKKSRKKRRQTTGNTFGPEGMRTLGEALKMNRTLATLMLGGTQHQQQENS